MLIEPGHIEFALLIHRFLVAKVTHPFLNQIVKDTVEFIRIEGTEVEEIVFIVNCASKLVEEVVEYQLPFHSFS